MTLDFLNSLELSNVNGKNIFLENRIAYNEYFYATKMLSKITRTGCKQKPYKLRFLLEKQQTMMRIYFYLMKYYVISSDVYLSCCMEQNLSLFYNHMKRTYTKKLLKTCVRKR